MEVGYNQAMLALLTSIVVISFSGVMMPGPMFAVTLAKSYKSPLAGAQMALGHAVVEVPLIMLIYFGFAPFFQHLAVQFVLSLVGGGMVVWMGIGLFRSRSRQASAGSDLPYSAFVAGIMMTGLNPFFLLWWASIGSLLIMKFYQYAGLGLVLFTVAHWMCDLIWLSLVSVAVYKTHGLWGRRFQEWVFAACAVLLLIFGVWFMYSGVRLVV